MKKEKGSIKKIGYLFFALYRDGNKGKKALLSITYYYNVSWAVLFKKLLNLFKVTIIHQHCLGLRPRFEVAISSTNI